MSANSFVRFLLVFLFVNLTSPNWLIIIVRPFIQIEVIICINGPICFYTCMVKIKYNNQMPPPSLSFICCFISLRFCLNFSLRGMLLQVLMLCSSSFILDLSRSISALESCSTSLLKKNKSWVKVVHHKSLYPVFRTGFSVHNNHLNLCGQVENSKNRR